MDVLHTNVLRVMLLCDMGLGIGVGVIVVAA